MRLISKFIKKVYQKTIALLLTLITIMGVLPLQALGSDSATGDISESVASTHQLSSAYQSSSAYESTSDSTEETHSQVIFGIEPTDNLSMPEYIMLDGERVYLDDPRIVNVIHTPAMLMDETILEESELNGIAPSNINIPAFGGFPAGIVVSVDVDHIWPFQRATMTLNGRTSIVSPMRYMFVVDGVQYEIYCLDPTLPGPENASANYHIEGTIINPLLKGVLRQGFPANPYRGDGLEINSVINAYITRVAVAQVSYPNATFGDMPGGVQDLINDGILFDQPPSTWPPNWLFGNFETTSPAIAINGVRHRVDLGRSVSQGASMAQSETFSVTYNRRTALNHNPFYFEWCEYTPAGSRLIVNGQTFTAPSAGQPRRIPQRFSGDVSFHLEMPNTSNFNDQVAKVYLVGIHNEMADQVWYMGNPNPTVANNWQRMAFYIPYIRSSAAFSFIVDMDSGELLITKESTQGNRLAGAVFTVTGPNGNPITGSPFTTPANGILHITDLELGLHTITETTPPPNHLLANPITQTVNVTAGSAGNPVQVLFVNPPITATDEAGIRIVKRSAITNQGLAGATFNITGPNGFNETRTTPSGGAILLTGLSSGVYTITEVSPPTDYQLSSPVTQTVTIPVGSTAIVERIFVNQRVQLPNAEPSSITIQKIDALTRRNIPGALVHLQGMTSQTIITGDGQSFHFDNTGINISQVLTAGAVTVGGGASSGGGNIAGSGTNGSSIISTVGDGVWTLENLPYGFYMVREIRAPNNYSLLPAHTADGFWVLPPNITIDAEVDYRIYFDYERIYDPHTGLLIDVVVYGPYLVGSGAGSPGTLVFNMERIYHPQSQLLLDVVIYGPYIEYDVNFIIIQEPRPTEVLITLENYPFGQIEVLKFDEVTGQPLAGAHIRLQGFFPEGNPGGMPIDRTAITDNQGRIIFDNLPAGQYTISEIFAPLGYVLDNDFVSVSITWGQSTTVHLYNTPKTYLEVLKVDGSSTGGGNSDSSGGNSGSGNDGSNLNPLAGAIFELRDPTTGETWRGVTGSDGIVALGDGAGSGVNELIAGRTYILREIQAPSGFVLDSTEHIVVLSNTGRNLITISNHRNPGLTVIKQDQDTNEPLVGAEFTIVAQGSGRPLPIDFPLITGADGTIHIPWTLFEGESERTFMVTEVVAPQGYHLSSPNWQVVTMIAGHDNTLLFQNRRMPTITIIKQDAVADEPIRNAEFTVERLSEPNRGMLTNSPFRTDADGRIVIPFQHAGQYRIVGVTRSAITV